MVKLWLKTPNCKNWLIISSFSKEQANVLGKQQEYFAETLQGLKMTQGTINEIESLPENHEIILPIGNRAFVKARIQDPSMILVAVSKNVIMEKSVSDAQAYTQKLLDDLTETQKRVQDQLQKIVQQLDQMKEELNRRVGTGSAAQGDASTDF